MTMSIDDLDAMTWIAGERVFQLEVAKARKHGGCGPVCGLESHAENHRRSRRRRCRYRYR